MSEHTRSEFEPTYPLESHQAPSPNIELLRKTVEWVEFQELLTADNPEREWNQQHWIFRNGAGWSCETTMCFAGKIAMDDGWEPLWGFCNGNPNSAPTVVKNDMVGGVQDVATELLGLDPFNDYHIRLFAAHNTAADIRHIAEVIAGEKL